MGKPVKEMKEGVIKAAIWKNEYGGKVFYSVSISRSYKDKNDQWKSTSSINEKDISDAIKVFNACAVWIADAQKPTIQQTVA